VLGDILANVSADRFHIRTDGQQFRSPETILLRRLPPESPLRAEIGVRRSVFLRLDFRPDKPRLDVPLCVHDEVEMDAATFHPLPHADVFLVTGSHHVRQEAVEPPSRFPAVGHMIPEGQGQEAAILNPAHSDYLSDAEGDHFGGAFVGWRESIPLRFLRSFD